jgi:hypothetical protein
MCEEAMNLAAVVSKSVVLFDKFCKISSNRQSMHHMVQFNTVQTCIDATATKVT